MKRICLITMARNDNFFLQKWMSYYGPEFGFENLFIYLDGLDSDVPCDPSGKVNIIPCEKRQGTIHNAEPARLAFLSDRAAEHFAAGYEIVMGCDADEFLVVDPRLGVGLGEYLSSLRINRTVSGLGLDVAQNENCESVYDPSRPILSQRHFAVVEPDYTKPCIMTRPMRWGVGFHRIKGCNYHIDKNLFMFHFGCFDADFIASKFASADLRKSGWEYHLKFRRRVIEHVSSYPKPRDGEDFLPIARFIQRVFRPIYKWNRPSMLGKEIVITIPERFRNLI